MDSETHLCNEALALLGADTILSVDDNTKQARLSKRLYPTSRDQVMRAHPWNCCIERTSLAQLEEAPAWGYSYQYNLPTNPYCLRVLQMEDLSYKFRIEGRKLLTDEGTAKIIYIARRTDVGLFDELMAAAIAARLAAKLAYPLTDSRTLASDMWSMYKDVLGEARSIDAQEGTPETLEIDTWINARL